MHGVMNTKLAKTTATSMHPSCSHARIKNCTCVLNQSTHEVLLPVCLISMLVLLCSSTVVPLTLISNATQWRSNELVQLIIFSLSHIPPTKLLAVAPFFTFLADFHVLLVSGRLEFRFFQSEFCV
jgi:hypothetical protein